ncbi:tetratricopeptide repeat protein [Mycoplasmatota bacterium WC44]
MISNDVRDILQSSYNKYGFSRVSKRKLLFSLIENSVGSYTENIKYIYKLVDINVERNIFKQTSKEFRNNLDGSIKKLSDYFGIVSKELVDNFLLMAAIKYNADYQTFYDYYYKRLIDENRKVAVEYLEKSDFVDGVYYLKECAKYGDDLAQRMLGDIYFNGRFGQRKDYGLAFQYYVKASDNLNLDAMNRIGYMYQKGIHLEKDINLAIEWYSKAADQGNLTSAKNAGFLLYKYGKDNKQLIRKSASYLKLALDDAEANYVLAKIYEKGLMGQINLEKANQLYKNSADKGYKKAIEKLKL